SDLDVGRTALVGLALLAAGQSHQSPPIASALRYLKNTRIEGQHVTYCLALRAAFYSQLPEPLRRTELPADTNLLRSLMIDKGDDAGLYTYNKRLRYIGSDFSNSQYAVLGVWYAAQAGVEAPSSYWKTVEAGWLKGQCDDGGWGYHLAGTSPTGSMTPAGAATLFITNDYLQDPQEPSLAESQPQMNVPLNKAVEWLGRNFSVSSNPGRDIALNNNMPARDGADPNNDLA